jgi:hypothetical protein
MDSSQIGKLIECFHGTVLALDELPQKRVTLPFMCIFNSQQRIYRGDHWLALACVEREGKRIIYHFDSLGLVPCLEPVINFININNDGYLYCNSRPIQNPSSSTCGLYAVLFLHWIQSGGEYDAFLRQFSDTPIRNDQKITSLFRSLSGIKRDANACESISSITSEL